MTFDAKMLLLTIVLGVLACHSAALPLGIEYAVPTGPLVKPNHAVLINAENESLLPRELLKSRDFYDNPAVAAGLARESWFTNKEMQVVQREAERIPREKIYDRVKSAGFLDR